LGEARFGKDVGMDDRPQLCFRAAQAGDERALTDLALRSKAHWGYDAEFLAEVRDELTFVDVAGSGLVVAEADHRLSGFYGLTRVDAQDVDLTWLFVDPAYIGRGVGRSLWSHAIESAQREGFRRLLIEADPHAVPFYQAMGAVVVGEAPSGSIPGRSLPVLALDVVPDPRPHRRR
jgi:GNAT superfamily N-acetyltransferase